MIKKIIQRNFEIMKYYLFLFVFAVFYAPRFYDYYYYNEFFLMKLAYYIVLETYSIDSVRND